MDYRLLDVEGNLLASRILQLERYVNGSAGHPGAWDSDAARDRWALRTLERGLRNITRDAYASKH